MQITAKVEFEYHKKEKGEDEADQLMKVDELTFNLDEYYTEKYMKYTSDDDRKKILQGYLLNKKNLPKILSSKGYGSYTQINSRTCKVLSFNEGEPEVSVTESVEEPKVMITKKKRASKKIS